jgi:hypothetical protein
MSTLEISTSPVPFGVIAMFPLVSVEMIVLSLIAMLSIVRFPVPFGVIATSPFAPSVISILEVVEFPVWRMRL